MVKVYVEGGGESKYLKSECRKNFKTFLEKASLKDNMPRVIAKGARQAAYDAYCIAHGNGDSAVLLVDSEGRLVTTTNPANRRTGNRGNTSRSEMAGTSQMARPIRIATLWCSVWKVGFWQTGKR